MRTDKSNRLQVLIHIMVWGLLFAIPFFLVDRNTPRTSDFYLKYLGYAVMQFWFVLIFYANYLWLIDKYLFHRKVVRFFLANILLIAAVILLGYFWREYLLPVIDPPKEIRPDRHRFDHIFFIFRDILSYVLVVGLGVAVKMTINWYHTEAERKELEKSRTEAELKNLKSQLNPHFLFNTLNNIYSLIAFSPEKAQNAVHDLSKLLRYVLYDDNQNFVPIGKELEFVRNYIDLMKIRLTDRVRVEVGISDRIDAGIRVAPLLFITLIENAFKHGVSYSEPSFIRIELYQGEDEKVVCSIENSYFPKTEQDKSGSGIGLDNLKKRLELLYPGRYKLRCGKSDDTYVSVLVISTKEEK